MIDNDAKKIIKNSSIIAIVQVIQILFGVLRTKAIALILGPHGVGISGLFQSTIQLISSFGGVGLSQSIVKSVAESKNSDLKRQNDVINTSLILVTIMAFLVVILTIVYSKKISLYTFGNHDFSTGISILSITVFANLLYAHFIGIIQGLRKLKQIAIINLFSSVMGFLLVVPIYYFWGLKGIVPSIIVISIANFTISFLYVKPIISFQFPDIKIFKFESLALMKLGVALALSGIFVTFSSYLIRIYIAKSMGVTGVGLLNSATTITTVYLSLIFTAMSTDFYPKLSQLNNDDLTMNKTVNEQILIGLLIAGPIIIFFIAFSDNILSILYSNKFGGASGLLRWQLQGTMIKAFSWPIGFILLAKGNSKIFILTELTWNSSYYFLSVYFWDKYSLISVGLAYLIAYIVLTMILLAIVYKETKFKITYEVLRVTLFYCLNGFLVICLAALENSLLGYILFSLIIMVSFIYSFIELNKHINLRNELKKQIKKIMIR